METKKRTRKLVKVGPLGFPVAVPSEVLKVRSGTCMLCHCTDDKGCSTLETFQSCAWANKEHTICTSCVGLCKAEIWRAESLFVRIYPRGNAISTIIVSDIANAARTALRVAGLLCLLLISSCQVSPFDLDGGADAHAHEVDQVDQAAHVDLVEQLDHGGSADACPPVCNGPGPTGCCLCELIPGGASGCCESTQPPATNHHSCCGVPCP